MLWLLRYLGSALFGPRIPQIQVGYCGELDHMIILIGNNMPSISEVATRPVPLPDGIAAIAELWASDRDLFEVCRRAVAGSPTGPGLCLAVQANGPEGERIAGIMRRDRVWAIRVYLAVLREVGMFRAQPDFAERAGYWMIMRTLQRDALTIALSFAGSGVNDENAALYVIDIAED